MSVDESSEPDVLVLRKGAHGISTAEYAAALRDRLPDDVTVKRAATARTEREGVETARVVTGGGIDEALLARASNLELFACTSAGVNDLPLGALADRGVAVTNASGVHGPNIAEHVIGSLLLFARDFRRFWRQQKRGEWRQAQATELQGSTVTVVGLGAIGNAVVERLKGFGVTTIGARYTPEKGGPTDEVVGFRDGVAFEDALARTDYLVLACQLSEETAELIGEREFATLEPHAVVVNVARGPVVDTDALVAALQGNEIDGAALDVTDPEPLPGDHPLWDLANAFVTPHSSGHTPAYYERCAEILATNWARLTGEEDPELENRVT